MVVEVNEGMIEGDVHDCLFPKGVSPNRFFMGANVGVGKKVHNITRLTAPHGSIEGWFPCTWGDFCA